MSSVWDDTIGGFNAFVKTQKEQLAAGASATLSLVQFDDAYEPNYFDVPVQNVQDLSRLTYQPRGSTALLDAIGRTITDLGAKLSAMPEAVRPGKVVVLIITDGQENASKEYSQPGRIKTMIEHQRSAYAWQFVYIGANQDAITVGASMGILRSMSASYTPNNTKGLFAAAAANVSAYRSASPVAGDADLAFTDAQRAALTQEGTP